MGAGRVSSRYPRRGERIAPQTLREFLMEPIPAVFGAGPNGRLQRLCDLDESAWEHFPPTAIAELSRRIVDRVAAYHVRKVFQHRHFPRPPRDVRLENLRLENRTRRCLLREGFDGNLEALGDHTIGEILALRAFGPRCLVDLLSGLESAGLRLAEGAAGTDDALAADATLTAAAQELAQLPEARLVYRADPRFAAAIEALDAEARTAAEVAAAVLARRHDPPDPAYAADLLVRLAAQIRALPNQTIEQELIALFGHTPFDRNRQILLGYYGWDDGQQHTLTEVGNRFGITRERVRQICAKQTRKPKALPLYVAPVTDRALMLTHQRLPCAAEAIEGELVAQRLTGVGLQIENLATAAKLLQRRVEFRVVAVEGRRLVVAPDQAELVPAICDLAKKELYFHGLSTVSRIEQLTAARYPGRAGAGLVRETLQCLEGFVWLDPSAGWFRLRAVAKHGLPKTVDKILAVAGTVSLAELRAAMGRNRRLWRDLPAEHVLRAFCEQMPGVRVEGDRIISDPPRDWRQALAGVEAKLVEVLKAHGPVMERNALEDLCVGSGMNRFSFHAFVSWSPVIQQFGHSVYGLLGTQVAPGEVAAILAARRTQRGGHRVLERHGRTADGKVWLSYRLSKAASTYAVITVPAALKNEVHGKFDLLAPDGRKVGQLATKEGRAWGLGAMLRQCGAQIDDEIILTLDLAARTATVRWCDDGAAAAGAAAPAECAAGDGSSTPP